MFTKGSLWAGRIISIVAVLFLLLDGKLYLRYERVRSLV